MNQEKQSDKSASGQNYAVSIVCDGREIPLVPYIETLFGATIGAMLETLKGTEDAKSITISLSKRTPPSQG